MSEKPRVRTLLLILAMAAAPGLPGCAPTLAVVPQRDGAGAPGDALHLRVLTTGWTSAPHDLPAYFVPVSVQIHNRGAAPLQVRLVDFVLADERGREVPPCSMDQALRVLQHSQQAQPRTGPMVRVLPEGPSMLSTRPRTSPEEEPVMEGATVTPAPSDPERLSLVDETVAPGGQAQGFLFFRLPDLHRPRSLVLRLRLPGGPTLEVPLQLVVQR